MSLRTERGTSLAELLMDLLRLGLVFLVVADLVTHSMTPLGATGRSVRNPLTAHVIARLRGDIEDAAGLRSGALAWSRGPLELRTQDGTVVRLELDKGLLLRKTGGAVGPLLDEQILLRGVTAWWWKTPAPGVVDLRIGYLVHPDTEQHASRTVGFGRVRRTENLRFALRGGGGGTRW